MKKNRNETLIKRDDLYKFGFWRPKMVKRSDFEEMTLYHEEQTYPIKSIIKHAGLTLALAGGMVASFGLITSASICAISMFTPLDEVAEKVAVTSVVTEMVGMGVSAIGTAIACGMQISIERKTKEEENVAVLPRIE